MSGVEYTPQKGDIVRINFSPSSGQEIKKYRPALVISNAKYSKLTGLVLVCPITHAENNRLINSGLFVAIKSKNINGYVNPLQFHTFDFRRRGIELVGHVSSKLLSSVIEVIDDVVHGE
ncbi:type II toxin-antitoxin system PemK/MazF family toxin [Xylocopilactobacillus apicola]|uniref:Transcriptional regulator n=1 Tax=Xylocopilactobacillus apicola TaxID=2932184 RepID=A0AAU9DZC3_9LACO|nr:type II toxin-antitoxin system PemK/MazF family toxin [Xylocopilactobacillus apicola]BDR59628.1 transcriptional regulator [Xylocopilactobacillus apicola]